jgi:very-short-patch-repair endonuclease
MEESTPVANERKEVSSPAQRGALHPGFLLSRVPPGVELDGQEHFYPKGWEHDLSRTEFLEGLNIRVLRFENRDVFEHLDWVLRVIAENLAASRCSPP